MFKKVIKNFEEKKSDEKSAKKDSEKKYILKSMEKIETKKKNQ